MSRMRLRYDSDDPSPVALPASVGAVPSIISPGDVVELDADAAKQLLAQSAHADEQDPRPLAPRWTRAGKEPVTTPYTGLTRDELAVAANLRDLKVDPNATEAELLAALEAADKTHPQPPGPGTGDVAVNDTPAELAGGPPPDARPDPATLKGQALDDALTAAGLPVEGKADEKRAALAEHYTATGTPTTGGDQA